VKIRKYPVFLIFSISLVFIIVICGCAANNNQQRNNQAGQQNKPAQDADDGKNAERSGDSANVPSPVQTIEKGGIKSGMYKAGEDIPAGEYKLYSTGSLTGLSYFEIAKDSSGTFESIIANDNFYSVTYVTVKEGQYFKFTDSYAVPVQEAEASGPEDGKYPSGMYKVGFDIPAGEYQVFPEEDSAIGYGYYEITSASTHSLNDIIANDNFEDPRYITLKEGQYIKLSEAYIKAK